MKPKNKFVAVVPLSKIAKSRFADDMDLLHSCRVEKETETDMYLSSISGRYLFTYNKQKDTNWKLIK